MENEIGLEEVPRAQPEELEQHWWELWKENEGARQNCTRYLESRGLNYFLACVKAYPRQETLLRSMLEVLESMCRPGNVERAFLRSFFNLLNAADAGIELVFDEDDILAEIDPDEEDIDHRCLRPLLAMLYACHTPQCQHWSVWALANLTGQDPERYCAMLLEIGGVLLLQQFLALEKPHERAKQLATIVIANCAEYEIEVQAAEAISFEYDTQDEADASTAEMWTDVDE